MADGTISSPSGVTRPGAPGILAPAMQIGSAYRAQAIKALDGNTGKVVNDAKTIEALSSAFGTAYNHKIAYELNRVSDRSEFAFSYKNRLYVQSERVVRNEVKVEFTQVGDVPSGLPKFHVDDAMLNQDELLDLAAINGKQGLQLAPGGKVYAYLEANPAKGFKIEAAGFNTDSPFAVIQVSDKDVKKLNLSHNGRRFAGQWVEIKASANGRNGASDMFNINARSESESLKLITLKMGVDATRY